MKMPLFHGVFPAVPTPFYEDERIAFDALQKNLATFNETPTQGFVIGGSNGEFVHLSVEERESVVRKAREVIPPDRKLIAGAGMEGTLETLRLSERLIEAGADALIVVNPSYYTKKMDASALLHHYRKVADVSVVPIMLYSVPANTGIELPVEVVVELSAHPIIHAIKDSGWDVPKIEEMVQRTSDEFEVLAGSAGYFLPALQVGAVGCISAFGNLAPGKLGELMGCFQVGDLDRAEQIQAGLMDVNHAVTAGYGVSGLKAAMDLLGYYGGPPRSPLQALHNEERARLRELLALADLLPK
jgi:4-hydroxy-2-oxoglutarate aldolase